VAELISVAEAWARLRAHAPDMQAETVDISAAGGRVLSADIVANITQPPFAASAMDGYAVRFADAVPGARLKVTGEAPAGSAFAGQVRDGDAVRIFTGGVVPEGADHVIIQEDVSRVSDTTVVMAPQDAPANIRAAGIDFRKGDVRAVAEIAGVMAAKRTADLIPMCHPLALSRVEVRVEPEEAGLRVTARVKTTGPTGVEMEALTAASVACLTLYDMLKAAEKGMVIEGVRLLEKTGGKSGDWRA